MTKLIISNIIDGYQTDIPKEIIERFHIKPGDEIIWSIIGDQINIRIKSNPERDPMLDLLGKFTTKKPENATELIDNIFYDDK